MYDIGVSLKSPQIISGKSSFGSFSIKSSLVFVLNLKPLVNLEITDLQVFNSALGVQLKKRVLKPGAQTKMKITAYGKYLKRVKGTPRVLMITNDPNCPKIIVKVNVTD